MADSISRRIAALEDREAIRDLISRYGPLADRGDCVGAAALWTENGIYDVGGYGVHHGRASIQALLEGEAHQGLIAGGAAHVLTMPVIELDGEEATAWTYSCVFRHIQGRFEPYRVAANRWRLARTRAGWRVAERVHRMLDGDQAARLLLALPDT